MSRGIPIEPLLKTGLLRVPRPTTACVVGGGLAGVAAATVLAERGVEVTLCDAEPSLGGRVSATEERLSTGQSMQVGRGFHAFFRQYYNLRNLLRRLDPTLSMLTPLPDYPLLGSAGAIESFAGLSTRTPLNLIQLVRRTEHIKWHDLVRVNAREALSMLDFDAQETYGRYDQTSARAYLDSLRFPPRARAMLFNVFAHSFFNPEEDLSAGELLMMFHFYFTGNPEGLLFDVMNRPFSHALWTPMAQRLEQHGVRLRLGRKVQKLTRLDGQRFAVETESERYESDLVVLALNVPGLKQLVAQSDTLDHPSFRRSVARLEVTRPFVVWRMWLDREASLKRAPFAGTTEFGHLDNISLLERFEDESRAWSVQTRGSVVELHAYAVEPGFDEASLRRELWSSLLTLYPELRGARVLDECWFARQDCPSFAPGTYAERPEVQTSIPGLTLAGDFVKLPLPSALMERATASGMLAANHLLAPLRVQSEPIYSVPARGLLSAPAPLRVARERLRARATMSTSTS